MSTIIVVTCIR